MSSLISSIGISFGEVCASLAVGIIAATWIKAVEESVDEGHRQAFLSKCEETADEAQNRICMVAVQNLKQQKRMCNFATFRESNTDQDK